MLVASSHEHIALRGPAWGGPALGPHSHRQAASLSVSAMVRLRPACLAS